MPFADPAPQSCVGVWVRSPVNCPAGGAPVGVLAAERAWIWLWPGILAKPRWEGRPGYARRVLEPQGWSPETSDRRSFEKGVRGAALRRIFRCAPTCLPLGKGTRTHSFQGLSRNLALPLWFLIYGTHIWHLCGQASVLVTPFSTFAFSPPQDL